MHSLPSLAHSYRNILAPRLRTLKRADPQNTWQHAAATLSTATANNKHNNKNNHNKSLPSPPRLPSHIPVWVRWVLLGSFVLLGAAAYTSTYRRRPPPWWKHDTQRERLNQLCNRLEETAAQVIHRHHHHHHHIQQTQQQRRQTSADCRQELHQVQRVCLQLVTLVQQQPRLIPDVFTYCHSCINTLVSLILDPVLPNPVRCSAALLLTQLGHDDPRVPHSLAMCASSLPLIAFLANYSHPQNLAQKCYQERQMQMQQSAHTHPHSDVYGIDADEAAPSVSPSSPHCEIDELLSDLRSLPNLSVYLQRYLVRQETRSEQHMGEEDTLPSLHPQLAKEDLQVLQETLDQQREQDKQGDENTIGTDDNDSMWWDKDVSSLLSEVLSSSRSVLLSFLSRHTYSYHLVVEQKRVAAQKTEKEKHFHALRLLASLCSQKDVSQWLNDRGLIDKLGTWFNRHQQSGDSELREAVQVARLFANINSHPINDRGERIALLTAESDLMNRLIQWSQHHSADKDNISLSDNTYTERQHLGLTQQKNKDKETSPSAVGSSVFPLSVSPASLVSAFTDLKARSVQTLHLYRDSKIAQIQAFLNGAVQPHTETQQKEADNTPNAVVSSAAEDSPASLLNHLHSQAVRAIANINTQLDGATAHRIKHYDSISGSSHSPLCMPMPMLPLYSDEVYLIHPALLPLQAAAKKHIQIFNTDKERGMDVIFVHGLLGNPLRTWRLHTQYDQEKQANSSLSPEDEQDSLNVSGPSLSVSVVPSHEVIWPRDWLPSDLLNPASLRILSIGFRSSLLQEGIYTDTLEQRAQQFIVKVRKARVGQHNRRVVFITHSMGGLLAKQMLLLDSSLAAQTAGIVFLSTPHSGAWLPKHSTARQMIEYIAPVSTDLKGLEKGSQTLADINTQFKQLVEQHHIQVLSLGESEPTPIPPNSQSRLLSLLLVPPDSANPGYGEYHTLTGQNHLNICKPTLEDRDSDTRTESMYRLVTQFIQQLQKDQQ